MTFYTLHFYDIFFLVIFRVFSNCGNIPHVKTIKIYSQNEVLAEYILVMYVYINSFQMDSRYKVSVNTVSCES